MKRIGILTAGGDTPALNATIHGAVVRANQLRVEIVGLIKGFNCLFNPKAPHVFLNPLYQEIPEYLTSIFTDAVGGDDVEHMRQTLFASGNLRQPYHSINTDINKRIRYLDDVELRETTAGT